MDASIAPLSGLELILATDLDGTFLPPENMYEGARLYRLIREHRERIALIFVTGRGFESILTLLDDPSIPIPDYIIADVGGTLLRRQGDGFSPILPLQDEITQGWQGREQILATARQIEGLHFQEVPQEYRCSFTYDSDAARIHAQAKLPPCPGKVILLSPIVGEFANQETAMNFIPPRAEQLLEIAKTGSYPAPCPSSNGLRQLG